MKLALLPLMLLGCATPQTKTYIVDGFTLHTGDRVFITDEWRKVRHQWNKEHMAVDSVDGFAIPANREIWVKDDGAGNPDERVLGHEIKHLLGMSHE